MAKNEQKSDQEKRIERAKKKSERFVKLVTKRVNKTLKGINSIASLSNRNSYSFDEAQVGKIFAALDSSIAKAKARFESTAPQAEEGFSL